MMSVVPCLWFDGDAEEAAEFYVGLIPNSRITHVARMPDGGPAPAGTAMLVSFELDDAPYRALNGGPQFAFTEAMSLCIDAPTQLEIDRLWDALTADGGEAGRCGWLKDRFGVSWQIVPPVLGDLMGGPDPAASGRVMQAMLGMTRIVISDLQAAHAAG